MDLVYIAKSVGCTRERFVDIAEVEAKVGEAIVCFVLVNRW